MEYILFVIVGAIMLAVFFAGCRRMQGHDDVRARQQDRRLAKPLPPGHKKKKP